MINISKNIRIRQLDNFSMTFEIYRETKITPVNKEKQFKWIQEGGYYGNLEHCLKALKDYIIKEENLNNDNLDIIKLLDEINNKYVNTTLKVREQKDV